MANKRNIVKKRKFVGALLETGNPRQAALQAGYKRPNTGYDLLDDQDVQAQIRRELEKAGLGTARLMEEIRKGLESGKLGSHHEYLGIALKLHGHLQKSEPFTSITSANLYNIVIAARRERGLEPPEPEPGAPAADHEKTQ